MKKQLTSTEQLSRIIKLQAVIAESKFNLIQFMQLVTDELQEITNAKGAVVELVEGDEMVYSAASDALKEHIGLRLKRSGSLSGLCVEKAEILHCSDSETDSRVDIIACRRVGVRSMICAPLFKAGKAVGVLKVMASDSNHFSENDIQILKVLSNLLGTALGNQLLLDKLDKTETRLQNTENRLRALLEKF